MKRRAFSTARAPIPVGPYSQAVIHNGLMFISGQIAIDPVSKRMTGGSVEEESRVVMNNLKAIIEDAGAGMADILKTTCYLADMNDFPAFNDVYSRFFSDSPPARATVQAASLPLGARVEVDAVVALPTE